MPWIEFPAIGNRQSVIRYVLLFLVLLAGCAAQPGRLILSDDTARLDHERITAAAAPLVARGAVVSVVVVRQGDDSGADFTRRLNEAGLQQDNQIAPDGLALYISYEPRYSELRAGTRWSNALPSATLRNIRTEALNPALRSGTPNDGVAATLERLEGTLAVADYGIWGIGGVVGVVIMGLLFLMRENPFFMAIGEAWDASPPGRLAGWIWAQLPFARMRARQEAAKRLRWERYRLDSIARETDYAVGMARRKAGAQQSAYLDTLERSVQALHPQRTAFEQLDPQTAGLTDALRALITRYGDLNKHLRAYGDLLGGATATREQVEEACAALPPESPWPPLLTEQLARLDADKAELEVRLPNESDAPPELARITEEYTALRLLASGARDVNRQGQSARERFEKARSGGRFGKKQSRSRETYEQQLNTLEAQRLNLEQAPSLAQAQELQRLAAAYLALDHAIWQIQDPRTYAAALQRNAAAASASSYTDTSSYSSSSYSSSDSSSSSSWSSSDSGSSSDSSSPSSDGGSW